MVIIGPKPRGDKKRHNIDSVLVAIFELASKALLCEWGITCAQFNYHISMCN